MAPAETSPTERKLFESAAHHACRRVPLAEPSSSARQVLLDLAGRHYESASHVIVRDGDRFAGIATIESVIAARPDQTLCQIMEAKAPVVAPGVDQEIAARRALHHGATALAVVDAEGRFIGVIPPQRLLAVLLSEHEEDLSRLGGFIKHTSAARASSEEPPQRRFRHRVPWLLVGLAGAMLAADIVGWFETQLHEKVILAFFLPGIVYLADAVGTQTETIVVRGLSLGTAMRQMVTGELLAGLAIGLALAAIATPLVWWRWGEANVALCVGLSLFAACTTSTVAAMGIPYLLNRLGYDPAFGSGPLATVIQDLLSILIYFGIAVAVMG